MRVLNLYAGIGGNRKNWTGCEVVAVERDPAVAEAYRRLYPDDCVVVGDAAAFLEKNFAAFDFVWSSPPCQSHSRMAMVNANKQQRYPDMSLYQQVLFLKAFSKADWVVENVTPYYEPLIAPSFVLGRHCFWSNLSPEGVKFIEVQQIRGTLPGFIDLSGQAGRRELSQWLGIELDFNLYLGDGHCPLQVYRNCVHPSIGDAIFRAFGGRAQDQGMLTAGTGQERLF